HGNRARGQGKGWEQPEITESDGIVGRQDHAQYDGQNQDPHTHSPHSLRNPVLAPTVAGALDVVTEDLKSISETIEQAAHDRILAPYPVNEERRDEFPGKAGHRRRVRVSGRA